MVNRKISGGFANVAKQEYYSPQPAETRGNPVSPVEAGHKASYPGLVPEIACRLNMLKGEFMNREHRHIFGTIGRRIVCVHNSKGQFFGNE